MNAHKAGSMQAEQSFVRSLRVKPLKILIFVRKPGFCADSVPGAAEDFSADLFAAAVLSFAVLAAAVSVVAEILFFAFKELLRARKTLHISIKVGISRTEPKNSGGRHPRVKAMAKDPTAILFHDITVFS